MLGGAHPAHGIASAGVTPPRRRRRRRAQRPRRRAPPGRDRSRGRGRRVRGGPARGRHRLDRAATARSCSRKAPTPSSPRSPRRWRWCDRLGLEERAQRHAPGIPQQLRRARRPARSHAARLLPARAHAARPDAGRVRCSACAGKLRMALEPFVAREPAQPRRVLRREPRRRSSPAGSGRETLERIAQPMVGGIYGADPDELSLAATFPRFLALEREHGSVLRGLARTNARCAASGARYGLFAALEGGMQTLVDALLAAPAACPHRARRCARSCPAARDSSSTARASTRSCSRCRRRRRPRSSRRSIARSPRRSTRSARDRRRPSRSPIARTRSRIRSTARASSCRAPRSPRSAGVIGGSFTHRKFEGRAPEGTALVRLFFADGRRARRRTCSPPAPTPPPVACWARASPRRRATSRAGPAACRATGSGTWRAFGPPSMARPATRGLALAGNSYTGVGIPDCIRSGEEAARRVLDALAD